MKFYKTETGKLVRKGKRGKGRFSNMFLWKPVKKVGFFYFPDSSREAFWLDDYGFEKVGRKREISKKEK